MIPSFTAAQQQLTDGKPRLLRIRRLKDAGEYQEAKKGTNTELYCTPIDYTLM
jgi:hypothetical protein